MNLFKIIYSGKDKYLELAEKMVEKAVAEKGREAAVKFPGTAYALPVIYAITGEKILQSVSWKSFGFGPGFCPRGKAASGRPRCRNGIGVLAEIIEAVKYTLVMILTGLLAGAFTTDAQIRAFGVPLVTYRISRGGGAYRQVSRQRDCRQDNQGNTRKRAF